MELPKHFHSAIGGYKRTETKTDIKVYNKSLSESAFSQSGPCIHPLTSEDAIILKPLLI